MSDCYEHAKRWTTAITSDTGSALDLYADDLVYDDRRDNDHVIDTPITKDELRPRIAPFANSDASNGQGLHEFEVLEAFDTPGREGARAVVFLWRWTGRNLAGFRGVPVPAGQTLQARGQTWHQLDADGKIVRESTYWNDAPVYESLGLPLVRPEYWKADFDPSALAS
ncbi:ketosteroid isomerase-related protein [Amycolatopsis thermoflava]|uniref:ketosteroid isomerase-related protein n=1 Tax=Amycolatopsis thermoflava TaxID=84480 RepID=UPI003826F885